MFLFSILPYLKLKLKFFVPNNNKAVLNFSIFDKLDVFNLGIVAMKLKSILHSLIITSIVSSLSVSSIANASELHSLPIEVQDYLSKQNIIVNQIESVGYFLIPTSDLEIIYDKNKVNLEKSGLTYKFSSNHYMKFFVFHLDESVMQSMQSKYTFIDEKATTYSTLKMNSRNQIIWKTNDDPIRPRLISTDIANPDIRIKLIRGRNLGLNFSVKIIN